MAAQTIRRGIRFLSVSVLVAGVLLTPSPAQAAATWRTAVEVPGSGTLNAGGLAQLLALSCGSSGSCSAGGSYTDAQGAQQGFVVNQVNGTWTSARNVPGLVALNGRGIAEIESISCPSAGNCSAGGFYTADVGGVPQTAQAFVVDEVSGTWRNARQVPGTGTLNAGGDARVTTISCVTGGNCSAGGQYKDAAGHRHAFVANRVNGTWRAAIELPGTAALNTGGSAVVNAISCPTAGNCSAGGSYLDGSGHLQAFVANRVNGTWRAAIEVPGSASLNAGGNAAVTALSCGSAGNCSAGGNYRDGSLGVQVFVVSRVNGTWGSAVQVPGTATLNAGSFASFASVSCRSAGNCSAGGAYRDAANHFQAFVVTQVSGAWGDALQLPGTASLNAGGLAQVNAVSCASAGNCSAGGAYRDSANHSQAFVADQVDGVWFSALEVPGTGALDVGGNAAVRALSCPSAGRCSAGGFYSDGSAHAQVFVVNKS